MQIYVSQLTQVCYKRGARVDSAAGDADVRGGIALVADGTTSRVRRLRRMVSAKKAPAALIAIRDGENCKLSDASAAGDGYTPMSPLQAGERLRELAAEWSADAGEFPVFIDVSCLSRPAIAEIFAAIRDAVRLCPVKLFVAYGLAKFSPPPKDWAIPNISVEPIHPQFCGWTEAPELPLNVVVGLGYERGKALGALEYLEPGKRFALAPHSVESEYRSRVVDHNAEILNDRECVAIDYDVLDPVQTYYKLTSLAAGIEQSARILLLPFGPKILLSTCLLLALTNKSIAVWHVAGEKNERNTTRRPSGDAVLQACVLTCLDSVD